MPMRVVSFKIDEKLLEELDTYCKLVLADRSEIIRRAIIYYLHHFYKNRLVASTERMKVWV